MAANDIDNEQKVNVVLALIGPDAYKLLKNLCDSEKKKLSTDSYYDCGVAQVLDGVTRRRRECV